jgi:hypothetical protein
VIRKLFLQTSEAIQRIGYALSSFLDIFDRRNEFLVEVFFATEFKKKLGVPGND